MSDIWDCEYYNRCLNNSRCNVCGPNSNYRLLTLPEDVQKNKLKNKQKVNSHKNPYELNKKDSWKHLEQTVAADLNALPSYKEARRQIRSGGLWFMPGDVDDTDLRIECKERGTLNSSGSKTFSILKEVLDKIISEAKMDNKFPGLVFRYKGDPDRYAVLPWQDLLDLIHQFKTHYLELDIVKKENEILKRKIKELEGDQ
jgi:hypothetical protein